MMSGLFLANPRQRTILRLTRALAVALLVAFGAAGSATAAIDAGEAVWPSGTAVIAYVDQQSLAAALARHPAPVVRRLPSLRTVVVKPTGSLARYASLVEAEPGIFRVERAAARRSYVEPALAVSATGAAAQWQFAATRADQVPASVVAAAAGVTIAVIDTGADLAAPDLAAKAPHAYSVRTRSADVLDRNGHGTFVAALAAGAGANDEGIAGVAGDAKLMVVQAGGQSGSFTDVEEAAAIVYAVDHGARILNLSLGGPTTSTVERRAIDYASSKGVLLVAAVGNSFATGNPVEYPAALLQPPGSRGVGGRGLSVGASNRNGARARFSSTGTHLSLAAPGEGVFSAVSSASPASRYPRVPLAGSVGLYGFGSGTSFAAPQVAGAAALVWAANPLLSADEVATILEQTASGLGTWTPELGYGVLDVAAAVARAAGATVAPPPTPVQPLQTQTQPLPLSGTRSGSLVTLAWPQLAGAQSFRVNVARDGGSERVLTTGTTAAGASYSLAAGSVYTFTVAALDAAGGQLSVSVPWTVSLRLATSKLSLNAVRSASRRVQLEARLQIDGQPGAQASLPVVLESFNGSSWSRAATAVTDASGLAAWRYSLTRGSYKLRARYAGSDGIAGATSAPVSLTVS
jgi:subtilisin family serine protease